MTGRAVRANSIIVHPQHHGAPILRIPCEITSGIFEFCLPKDEFPRPSIQSAPMQLSHVCSSWQKLAIQTPRLWSKVSLCMSTEDGGQTKVSIKAAMASHVKALKVWMRRATPLPMSVHLRYPSLPWLEPDKLPPVFRVIMENPTTWRDVRLSLPRDYLNSASIVVQKNVRNLERFDVEDTSIIPMFSRANCPVFLIAETAAILLTLSVHGSLQLKSPNATQFVRLRTLSLKHSSINNSIHLLENCPVLEGLNLHFYNLPMINTTPEDTTILLPRLRNFHLAHTGNDENKILFRGGEVGVLLAHLKLPNLSLFHLHMTIMGWQNDPRWDYLSMLIFRSNCSLIDLELRTPHIEKSTIVECLKDSPDLQYVGIPSDVKLEEEEARRLLPNLRTLRRL
ncbi:hypothetical protein BD410DRAFT_809074 [Rickenella mellea]|uniref:Uncharacterized protein n=1 Tax=Rickenella mellea TaxID=50990 RepID=A0A4Y7PJM2_9AGAM|nr:hypothetical protein BD410DRAFT_809074 [Rickenella mellea]